MYLTEEEYISKISSLKYLVNKNELLKNSNFQVKHAVLLLIDHIDKDWYEYIVDEYGYSIYIKFPNWNQRIVYKADYWFNNSTLYKIFKDKLLTTKCLKYNNFKTPDEILLVKENWLYSNDENGYSAVLNFAQEKWFPLIAKPIDWSCGRGVEKIFSMQQLEEYLLRFHNQNTKRCLIQKCVSWSDYRVVYLDWEILIAYERVPLNIKGDWTSSIGALLNTWLLDSLNMNKVIDFLNKQNYTLDTVLNEEIMLNLLPTANISTWWIAKIVETTKQDLDMMNRIAKVFWARYFGIDILSEWPIHQWTIIEVNNSPSVSGICASYPPFREKFWEKIWTTIKKDEWIL